MTQFFFFFFQKYKVTTILQEIILCIELLELSLVVLWSLYIFGKKKKKKNCVMIWLICNFLPFYAHVHTCSPSYTDEE